MSTSIPNLRHLRAFREVSLQCSISQASKSIYLSQPAITQAIAKLEKRLGVLLFERRSDGMYPTGAGQLFLARVDRALQLLSAGTREALRFGAESRKSHGTHLDQMMTATQLRALVAVADARNFSLAARKLGSSQPSLHRAARDLEKVLELHLFAKSSQGIDLTRAAQGLVQHVKLAFSELQQGFVEIELLQGRDADHILVGTMPLARSFILPKAMNDLATIRPNIRVSVVDGPYDVLLHGLRHGELDLLIGAMRYPAPVEDIMQEPLFDDPLVIVVRHGHPLSLKSDITIGDLKSFPWVVPRQGTPTRAHFDALFDSYDCPYPPGIIESSSLILIRGLLLGSDRITLISRHQIRYEQNLGLLDTLAFDPSGTTRTIGLTVRRSWHPTATQAQFLDLLRAAGDEAAAIAHA